MASAPQNFGENDPFGGVPPDVTPSAIRPRPAAKPAGLDFTGASFVDTPHAGGFDFTGASFADEPRVPAAARAIPQGQTGPVGDVLPDHPGIPPAPIPAALQSEPTAPAPKPPNAAPSGYQLELPPPKVPAARRAIPVGQTGPSNGYVPIVPGQAMYVGPVLQRVPGTETYKSPDVTQDGHLKQYGQSLTVPGSKPEGEQMPGAPVTIGKPASHPIKEGLQAPLVTPEDIEENFGSFLGGKASGKGFLGWVPNPGNIPLGIMKSIAAMTSPQNAAIVGGTMGLGAVPGVAAKTLSAGLDGLFALQAGSNFLEKFPEIKKAYEAGDSARVLELGGGALADAAMTYGAVNHAVSGWANLFHTVDVHNLAADETLAEEQRTAARAWKSAATDANARLMAEAVTGSEGLPVTIKGQTYTVHAMEARHAPGEANPRPYYAVVDPEGKTVFAGAGPDIAHWLGQRDASPSGGPKTPLQDALDMKYSQAVQDMAQAQSAIDSRRWIEQATPEQLKLKQQALQRQSAKFRAANPQDVVDDPYLPDLNVVNARLAGGNVAPDVFAQANYADAISRLSEIQKQRAELGALGTQLPQGQRPGTQAAMDFNGSSFADQQAPSEAPQQSGTEPAPPQPVANTAEFTKAHNNWNAATNKAAIAFMEQNPGTSLEDAKAAIAGTVGMEPKITDYKAPPPPPEPPAPPPPPPEPIKPSKVERVGPATPNPPTAAIATEPESPETIALQMQQLGREGMPVAPDQRKVVMFPKGQGMPPMETLGGLAVAHDKFGNVYVFRPDLVDRGEITRAASTNKLSELLGGPMGMGAPDKADLQGPPVAVVGRGPDGVEAQTTATDQASLPHTIIATHAVTPPGGTIEVKSPEEALGDRTGQAPIEHPMDEALYQQAVDLVRAAGKASTSTLQRNLRLGYGAASRMLDRMHAEGIIGPENGSTPRVLLPTVAPTPRAPTGEELMSDGTRKWAHGTFNGISYPVQGLMDGQPVTVLGPAYPDGPGGVDPKQLMVQKPDERVITTPDRITVDGKPLGVKSVHPGTSPTFPLTDAEALEKAAAIRAHIERGKDFQEQAKTAQSAGSRRRLLQAATEEFNKASELNAQKKAATSGAQRTPSPTLQHPLTYFSGKDSIGLRAEAQARGDVGLMVTPLKPELLAHADKYPVIAVDNGAFSKKTPFNDEKFGALIERIAADPSLKRKTQFVVAPDVVGDAVKTLALYKKWEPRIRSLGLPVAFVAQDGLEDHLSEIPWDTMDTLFVGGSTKWKEGDLGQDEDKTKTPAEQDKDPRFRRWVSIFEEAERRGIPVHTGRVNTFRRMEGVHHFLHNASTVDGTLLAYGEDANYPLLKKWLDYFNHGRGPMVQLPDKPEFGEEGPLLAGQSTPPPITAKDNSVRDFPVDVKVADGTVNAIVRYDRKPIGNVTFKVTDWPQGELPGLSNPNAPQRQMIGKLLDESGIAARLDQITDNERINANTFDRIADSIHHAVKVALGETPMSERDASAAAKKLGIDVSKYDRKTIEGRKALAAAISEARKGVVATPYPPPPIPGVQTTTALEPWFLGHHEGQPVTPERLADISDRIRNRPDEVVPGRGTRSLSNGESFNQFKDPLIAHVQNLIANFKPGDRILNVTHYRDVQAIKAWLKAGAPADRAVDTGEMVAKGDQHPGGLYRLDPATMQFHPTDNANQDGIYFLRHGATEWNKENAAAKHGESAELFRGSSNIDLTPQGVKEAQDAAARTAGQFTKIYASPLKRAQDTAAVVVQANPQVVGGEKAQLPPSAPAGDTRAAVLAEIRRRQAEKNKAPAPAPQKSWSYQIEVTGEKDKWHGVNVHFPTEEEAGQAGLSKFQNWMMATNYRIVQTDNAPNYNWDNGLKAIEAKTPAPTPAPIPAPQPFTPVQAKILKAMGRGWNGNEDMLSVLSDAADGEGQAAFDRANQELAQLIQRGYVDRDNRNGEDGFKRAPAQAPAAPQGAAILQSGRGGILPDQPAGPKFSPEAEAAAQAMKARMEARRKKGILNRPRQVEMDPEDMVNLGDIGVDVMRSGAPVTFQNWANTLANSVVAGIPVRDMLDFAAENANASANDVLRVVYDLASEIAKEYGIEAAPLPPEGLEDGTIRTEDNRPLESQLPQGDKGAGAGGLTFTGSAGGSGESGAGDGAVHGEGDAVGGRRGTGGTGVGNSPITPQEVSASNEKGETVVEKEHPPKDPAVVGTRHGHDYRIPDGRIVSGSPERRAALNIEALTVLRTLEAEDRAATVDEQRILANYVGWGGAKQLFTEKPEWTEAQSAVRNLMTPEEFEAALNSTMNAHYTGDEIVDSLWYGLRRLGVKPGMSWLEPAGGVGTMLGRQPEDLLEGTRRIAIDKDTISARIMKQLYPDSGVDNAKFESADLPRDYFDFSLSNVPFGPYPVHDPVFRGKGYLTASIHNYFFAKALTTVRPGGLVAFITSRYTMDSHGPEGLAFRRYIASKADFLGAVRLPSGAFRQAANTQVITDIVFLRRRIDGEQPAGPSWLDVIHKDLQNTDGSWYSHPVNKYYEEHPEMILGVQGLQHGEHTDHDYDVKGKVDANILREAMDRLPAEQFHEWSSGAIRRSVPLRDINADTSGKVGAFFFDADGNLFRKTSKGEALPQDDVSDLTKRRIRGQMNLRDIYTALTNAERSGADPAAIEQMRVLLNDAYDNYVADHGLLSRRENIKAMQGDPDAPLLPALERNYDQGNTKEKRKASADKAPVFRQRLFGKTEPVVPQDAKEALSVTLNSRGFLDWDYLKQISGKDDNTLADDLAGIIYKDPETKQWQTADEYLSGSVRTKLRAARAIARMDAGFEQNVKALEAAQPVDVPPSRIRAMLGVTWVPLETYSEFVQHMLNLRTAPRVVHAGNEWFAEIDQHPTTKWDTSRVRAGVLINAALNLRRVKVYDRGDNGPVVNREATLAAGQRQEEINDYFNTWLFSDTTRGDAMVRIYNDLQNDLRLRSFDGSHLTLPGLSRIGLRDGKLDPYQLAAVWRMIVQRNVLVNHAPGAGKTVEMIAAGMELKRLGLIQRPMYVVPNSTLGGWQDQFAAYYPQARVLVFSETDLAAKNRRAAIARIATGDWDAVVIPHSSFQFIPVGDEVFNAHYAKLERELQNSITDAEDAGLDTRMITRLERAKENLLAGLMDRRNSSRQDNLLTWEQLGIDQLFVDESHFFKKLGFRTKQHGVAGIDTNGNQKTFDLMMKTRYTQTHGRGVVFASGTPVTNTMGEAHSIMRYLIEPELEARGIAKFDDWASEFGRIRNTFERKPEGGGYQNKARFAKFVNLPRLSTLLRSFTDVMTSDMLNIPRPAVAGGGRQVVISEMNPQQEQFQQDLQQRAGSIRSNPRKALPDSMVVVFGDGGKMAMDIRMVDEAGVDDPEGRLSKLAEKVHHFWKQSEPTKGTQLVFMDLGVSAEGRANRRVSASGQPPPGKRTDFSPYDEVIKKLIDIGIPPDQIAHMGQAKNKQQRRQIFRKVDNGDIRVLLGSSEKMGVGVNIQTHGYAIHHVDVPPRPDILDQREARFIRQGNIHPEVHILYYSTKGTLDESKFGTVVRKGKFIDSLWKGDLTQEEAEDISEGVPSWEMFQALTSGDPRILRKLEVDSEVQRLSSLQWAFEDQMYGFRQRLQQAKSEIERLDDRAHFLEDAKNVSEKSGRVWVINGQTFTGDGIAENVGNALISDALDAKNIGRMNGKVIGAAHGLEIKVSRRELGNQQYPSVEIYHGPVKIGGEDLDPWVIPAEDLEKNREDNKKNQGMPKADKYGNAIWYSPRPEENLQPSSLTIRLENDIKRIGDAIKAAKDARQRNEDDVSAIGKDTDQKWPYQPQFDKLVSEQRQLETDLGLVRDDPTAAVMDDNEVIVDDSVAPETGSGEEEDEDESGPAELSRAAAPQVKTGKTYGPMSAYVPEAAEATTPRTWYTQDVNGKHYYSNGHYMLEGPTPEGPQEAIEGIAQYLKEPDGAVEVAPAAYSQIRSKEANLPDYRAVWFGPETVIDSGYFDYIKSQFPDATFWLGTDKTRLAIKSDGNIVGVVMGIRNEQPPAQIRAALGSNPGILSRPKSVAYPAGPVWFSQLEKTLESKMPAKASPAQVAAIVGNPQNGVKADEVQWTGLRPWLQEQKGPVTKQQVLDFVKSNAVQVEEVLRSDAHNQRYKDLSDKARQLSNEWYETNQRIGLPSQRPGDMDRLVQIEREQSEADRLLKEHGKEERSPKYKQYTIPGGKDYGELLLTLPEKPADPVTWTARQPIKDVSDHPFWTGSDNKGIIVEHPGHVFKVQGKTPNGDRWTYAGEFDNLEDAQKYYQKDADVRQPKYISPHWDNTPNVVAHIRFASRTSPTGEKVFHVEELQSDWHQQGRTKGYAPTGEAKEALDRAQQAAAKNRDDAAARINQNIARRPSLLSNRNQAIGRLGGLLRDNGWLGFEHAPARAIEAVVDYPNWAEKFKVTDAALIQAGNEYRAAEHALITSDRENAHANVAHDVAMAEVRRLQDSGGKGVPAAPFSKTWQELAFRRALRYAAENGFDRISWTTGKQQAGRYDLSKQVSKVVWTPAPKDIRPKTWDSVGTQPEGGKLEAFDKSGNSVLSKDMQESEIPDYVGKDVARKLLESPLEYHASEAAGMGDSHVLEGEDLQVGGHGMNSFYDEMLPRYAAKLGSRWGAKVEDSQIKASTVDIPHYTGPELSQPEALKTISKLQHEWGRDWNVTFNEQAMALYRAMEAGAPFKEAIEQNGSPGLAKVLTGGYIEWKKEPKTETVHSLPITPAMAESVMTGQPLFRPRLTDDTGIKDASKADAVFEKLTEGHGHVYVNRTAGDLITQVMDQLPSWGFTMDEPTTRELVDRLTALQSSPAFKSVPIRKLIDAIEDAAADDPIVSFVEAGATTPVHETRATRREEAFHRRQMRLGLAGTEGNISQALMENPAISGAVDAMRRVRGAHYDTETALIELGAMLGTDQGQAIGLDPKQSAEVLRQYFDALIEAHGPAAGTLLKLVAPRVRKALGGGYVKARWNGNFNAGAARGDGRDRESHEPQERQGDSVDAERPKVEFSRPTPAANEGNAGREKVDDTHMGSGLGALQPHLEQLYAQDIKPTAKAVSKKLSGGLDDIRQVFAPHTRGPSAQKGGGLVRETGAEVDQRRDRAVAALSGFRTHFYKDTTAEHGFYGLDIYDAVETGRTMGLNPVDRAFALVARRLFEERKAELQSLDILRTYVENYLPHEYKEPEEATRWIQSWQSKRPMAGSEAFRRQRTYPTLKEALEDPDFHMEAAFDNPVDMILSKLGQMDKSITAHRAFEELYNEGYLKYVPAGHRVPLGMAAIDDKIFTVMGPKKGAVGLPDEKVHAVFPEEDDEEGGIRPEDVTVFGRRTMGQYYAPEPLARVINNHLSVGVGQSDAYGVWRAINNAMNMIDLSASWYHGLTTTLNSSLSDMSLGIEQALAGKPLKGLASIGRGLVPFASVINDVYRGTAIQKAWDMQPEAFKDLAATDPITWAIVDALKAGGAKARQDMYYATSFIDGMKRAWEKNNPAGAAWRAPFAALEYAMKPIMQIMVPRVKLSTFAKLAQEAIESNPNMGRDEMRKVFGQIWDSVDNRFGQLAQRNLMMHAMARDAMNAIVGRPGWNLGSVREIVGGASDAFRDLPGILRGEKPISHRTAYLLALLLGGAFLNGMANVILSRSAPKGMDFIAPRDGGVTEDGRPSRIILPTYLSKDIYSYATRPLPTLKAKAAPFLTVLADVATNRNFQNQKIWGDDSIGMMNYMGSVLTPYSLQGLSKNIERGASPVKALLPFFGIMPAGKRAGLSKAEQMITDYQDEHREATRRPLTEHNRAQSRVFMAAKKSDAEAKRGEMAASQSDAARARQLGSQAVGAGAMNPQDVRHIMDRARQSPLAADYKNVRDVQVAMKIYEAATPDEKKLIKREANDKARRSLQKPWEWDDASKVIAKKYFNLQPFTPRTFTPPPTSWFGSPQPIQ
jgi:N12 class adenine-specific DNA methylase